MKEDEYLTMNWDELNISESPMNSIQFNEGTQALVSIATPNNNDISMHIWRLFLEISILPGSAEILEKYGVKVASPIGICPHCGAKLYEDHCTHADKCKAWREKLPAPPK